MIITVISISLWKQSVKSNYKVFLIFIAVLTMYISLIVSIFDPAIGKSMQAFAEAMPEVMAMFGMDAAGITLIDTLANYLYGFLLLILPLVFEIILANRLLASHVDKGSMAYLLASPNSRKKVAVTQMCVLLTAVFAIMAYSTVLGIVCSELMFPDQLDIPAFLGLNCGAFLLQFAISGICFFASCISNDTKLSIGIGAGIPTFFYLLQMLANMGGDLEKLKYASIFSLFNPKELLAGSDATVWKLGILAFIGAVLYAVGIRLFCKRDLPL